MPGTKSPKELRVWLEGHLDVERMPLEEVSQTSLWAMRHNIELHLGIDGAELEFVAYRILPTERNAPYLVEGKCVRVGIFEPRILMELTTGCLETTSNRLFDEYVVERGVGEKDLAEKTYRLLDYLFHLRNLEDPGWE